MDKDLTQTALERIKLLQNESSTLHQRLNQLINLQTDVNTRIVEIQGAIKELEIVLGKRDVNGQIIQAQPVINPQTNTEKK
jgi:hypothetical protein